MAAHSQVEPLQRMLLDHIAHGVGRWITPEAAVHWCQAIEGEWERVQLWRDRTDPEAGRRYSWLAAARVVAENPPTFDRMWAEAFDDG